MSYRIRVNHFSLSVRNLVNLLVAMCVLTGFSIMTASFVIYEVQEHHTGSKRLQHISGISEPFYWTVNFFYDMVRDGILHIVWTLIIRLLFRFGIGKIWLFKEVLCWQKWDVKYCEIFTMSDVTERNFSLAFTPVNVINALQHHFNAVRMLKSGGRGRKAFNSE